MPVSNEASPADKPAGGIASVVSSVRQLAREKSLVQGTKALRVVNPRYQGLDELNRPYTVTARTGQQHVVVVDDEHDLVRCRLLRERRADGFHEHRDR